MILLLAGLLVLIAGAELLVRGAARLAGWCGVSPLVIGLTIVAFGTSAPELGVSVTASWLGNGNVAVSNVIGSNIFNTLFILGLAALITPLRVAQQLIRLDVPLVVAVSILVLVFALDFNIGWLEGLILINALVLYIVFLIHQSYQENRHIKAEYAQAYSLNAFGNIAQKPNVLLSAFMLVLGLLLLTFGSRWMVSGALATAQYFQISEHVVGLTVVAIGTSLPEVATSLIAAVKGERDIAVGNVVGSNLFNLLGVLGLTGLLATDGATISPSLVEFDIPVMIVAAVACLPVLFGGHCIERWEGGVFLFYYLAYIVYMILSITTHPALVFYQWSLLIFAIPLTAMTIIIGFARNFRRPANG